MGILWTHGTPSVYTYVYNLIIIFLQAKIQKHQAFEAEVAAHSNNIVVLDSTGMEMINAGHYASQTIQVSYPYIGGATVA